MTDPDSYDEQLAINNAQMATMLKALFPDLTVPFEDLYKILFFLEETQVNPAILPRVIRGVHNIAIGTGQGDVVVHVREGLTTVEARERTESIAAKNTTPVDTKV